MKLLFWGKTIIIILLLSGSVSVYSQTFSNATYGAGSVIDIGAGADICADALVINGTYTGGGSICSGSLPVTLSSFEAKITKNEVKLIWVTENELNNSGFEVERASISKTNELSPWLKTGFIQGSGTTTGAKIYTFDDKKLNTGKYKFRLKQIDYNGSYEYFELVNDVIIGKPIEFMISQNYPNPGNPNSKIDFQMPFDGKVSIRIYDMLGKEVAILINEIKTADYYTVEFDGSNLASGIYFYRIVAQGEGQKFVNTKKMVLVK